MNKGGCPSWHCPPSMPTWHLWCSGSRSVGRPCPVRYPGPLDPGLLWPTTSVPGVPTTRYSPSQATLPAGQFYYCTPPNGYRAFTQHQQQNDLLFVNLTNPVTNIKLTPGSLGWESLLPPLIHSHHAFHIHSIHTQARWPILTHYTFSFHFSIHSILCLCSPNYLVLPRHPLN